MTTPQIQFHNLRMGPTTGKRDQACRGHQGCDLQSEWSPALQLYHHQLESLRVLSCLSTLQRCVKPSPGLCPSTPWPRLASNSCRGLSQDRPSSLSGLLNSFTENDWFAHFRHRLLGAFKHLADICDRF